MDKYYYENETAKRNSDELGYHVKNILKLIGENVEREGLIETPARVARMYQEIFAGYATDPRKTLGVTFDEDHNELVIIKDIQYYSQCEHHMMPFFGTITIGYVPNGKIAGLSKFARLVDAVTRRLQVQERVTSEIADIIHEVLGAKGVMVIVSGEHLCMCARGVKKTGSRTITSAIRGDFCSEASLRAEFLSLVNEH